MNGAEVTLAEFASRDTGLIGAQRNGNSLAEARDRLQGTGYGQPLGYGLDVVR